jgi:hypothetical protein
MSWGLIERPCAGCGATFRRDHGYVGNLRYCHRCECLSARFAGMAHRAVRAAVVRGQLARLRDGATRCADCGATAQVYDHRDYLRPLDVAPVCRRCNVFRGPAFAGQIEHVVLQ